MSENKEELDINKLMEDMSYEDLGRLVITKACNMQENKRVDIIDFVHTCTLVILAIKESTNISSSDLFYTMGYVMEQLKHVADEGGMLEIYAVNKEQ